MTLPTAKPPWKKNHEHIPQDWEFLGEGGNAIVWGIGQFAIKRLKQHVSRRDRFEREARVHLRLKGMPQIAVVEAHGTREREGQLEIVFERLEGNLKSVISDYRGSPQEAAESLLPVAEALDKLARLEDPIHHRDLKPENLLYRTGTASRELYLADFGCAFLASEERITPDHLAVGAWAYRAPEFSAGRVENVTEKGDVFSLGKVFWAMIYGQKDVVFPSTIWHLDEYNLQTYFPEAPGVDHAMLLVSKSSAIKPEDRPTLRQFITELKQISSGSELPEHKSQLSMLQAEARSKVRLDQTQASNAHFVQAASNDLLNIILSLHESNPESELFSEWNRLCRRGRERIPQIIQSVAFGRATTGIISSTHLDCILRAIFRPGSDRIPFSLTISVESGHSPHETRRMLRIENRPSGIVAVESFQGKDLAEHVYKADLVQSKLAEYTLRAISHA